MSVRLSRLCRGNFGFEVTVRRKEIHVSIEVEIEKECRKFHRTTAGTSQPFGRGSVVKEESGRSRQHQERVRLAKGLHGGVVMLGLHTRDFSKSRFSAWLDFLNATAADRGVDVEKIDINVRVEPGAAVLSCDSARTLG